MRPESMPSTWIVFARFEGGKRALNNKIMKIAEFDQIPLRSRVIYKRKEYILIDRIKRTHEAIIATKNPKSCRFTVRCSEIRFVGDN